MRCDFKMLLLLSADQSMLKLEEKENVEKSNESQKRQGRLQVLSSHNFQYVSLINTI